MRHYLLFPLLFLSCFSFAQLNVLHYDETTGFDHNTRTQSLALFNSLGAANNFTVTQDSDGSSFTQAILDGFDLVIFSNTSGNSGLSTSQRDALEWYIDVRGGSLLGIHAATDTYRHSTANGGSTGTWDWYAETIGGSVQQSPNHTSQNHVNDITQINAHPSTDNLMLPWTKEEEYYYWENGYLNADINEVLRVDVTGGNSYDAARPVAWSRTTPSGSRIYYTSLGHRQGNYTGAFPQFEQLIEDATLWLLGTTLLPVELIQFDGKVDYEKKAIELFWTTASEQNSDYFELQKSTDGLNWTTIQKKDTSGDTDLTTEYRAKDLAPNIGVNYYRLRQVDLDGQANISQTIILSFEQKITLLVFPNPVRDIVNLSFSETLNTGELILYNEQGKRLSSWPITNSKKLKIDLSGYTNGTYLFQVYSEGELFDTAKVIKMLSN